MPRYNLEMLVRVLAACALLASVDRDVAAQKSAAPALDAPNLERLCTDGAQDACTRLGRAYRDGREGLPLDCAQARRLLERACTIGQGHAPACTDLASLLHSGAAGVRKDELAAIAILDRACAGKEPSACSFLGLIYTEGLGVPYKLPYQRVGAGFYRKACELGHLGACWHLGLLLRSGTVVEKDLVAAHKLFERACKAGESYACTDAGQPAPP